jgi:S-adenosylmethionine decarboxylase
VRTQWMAELKNHILCRTQSASLSPPTDLAVVGPKGSFVTCSGKQCAGTHLIIDFQHATNLNDLECIREALIEAIRASNATLLHTHLHSFSGAGGVSGVAVLAESHISIHTWPEYGFAALDIFMCGKCNPYLAIPVLRRAFAPKEAKVQEFLRGELHGNGLMTMANSPRDCRRDRGD